MMHIGFIGVGNIGSSLIPHLRGVGFLVSVYDQDPTKSAALVGVMVAKSVREVVEPGGIVLSMVPHDQALLDITQEGLPEALGADGILLSMSTISPGVAEQLEKVYATRGSYFLAGTVLGCPDVAARAALSIYLSGAMAAKKRVLSLLQILGKVYDLGEHVASAPIAKLGVNSLILAALVAMGEVAGFVAHNGVDRAMFLRSVAESTLFSGSAVYAGYGQMIGEQHYTDSNFQVVIRGLPFVAVHTTVLGLQDVAPSLKQGVNNRRGKNQFGAYQAPAFVWGDATLFDTLPPLEVKSANCETIKNVLTICPDMYQALSARLRSDARYSYKDYRWLTEFCLDAKSQVMRHDAHEERSALLLEYGHTCGHAFEIIRQQVGEPLPHGIAIGLGMLVAARISVNMGRMIREDEAKHHTLLIRNGVHPRIPEDIDIRDVLELMRHDNKRGYITTQEGMYPMVLLEALGQPFRTLSGQIEMPTLVEEGLIVEAISSLQAI